LIGRLINLMVQTLRLYGLRVSKNWHHFCMI